MSTNEKSTSIYYATCALSVRLTCPAEGFAWQRDKLLTLGSEMSEAIYHYAKNPTDGDERPVLALIAGLQVVLGLAVAAQNAEGASK